MNIDVLRSQGVQVGNHNIQINNFLSRRVPLSWPHMVGVVPAQADCFQYRMALDAISAVTADGDGATVWILTGLGGAGKTQIAGKIACEAWDARRVDLLVWISAGSREAIVSGYAQAATDIVGGSEEDTERAAERFLAWLAATDRSWLLVLDDLTRPSDLRWAVAAEHG